MIYIEIILILVIFGICRKKATKIEYKELEEIKELKFKKEQTKVILDYKYYPKYKQNIYNNSKEFYSLK